MKIIIKLSFTGLIISILLSSCSMEKRVYMPGYHIETNNFRLKQARKEEIKIDHETSVDQNDLVASVQSGLVADVTENKSTIKENQYTPSNIKVSVVHKKRNNVFLRDHTTKLKAEKKESKAISSSGILQVTADEGNPYSGVAIAGFSCGMATLTYFALLLTGAFAGVSTFLGLFIIFVLPVLLIVFTLILSINGLRKTGGDWKKKGKGFAIAGLIIGSSVIFGLLYLFYYLLINGGWNSRGI